MPAALPPASRVVPAPDLLSREGEGRIDLAALGQLLVFAFAMGGTVEAFDDVLARADLPPTAWDRTHFARDLYLEQLVRRCFRVSIGGSEQDVSTRYLLRIISEPPRDPEELAFRQRVLEEIASSKERRGELERVYTEIRRLRGLLCAGRQPSQSLRRIEILRTIHGVFALLASSFEGATSGLERLREFGVGVCATDAYGRLSAVLDHEEHLGTIDLRVRVGSDGELRAFQIVSIKENTQNIYYSSPLARWLAKILFYVRGYRLSGGEVVERLFDDVFSGLEGGIGLLFQLMGDIEFYLAALGFRDLAEAHGLSVCFAEFGKKGSADSDSGMDIEGLFNPLLLGEHTKPVPCDLRTERAGSVVIVTGPNSGGKTRLLQAIAMTQLLGEAGFFVPAKRAHLPRAAGLFVSLLADERADQPEGHLGMELMRIRRMFEELEMGSLVLIDELCSGTNPTEGAEIARLVISLLPELDARVFVTTHLLQFAAHLATDRPIARLEFLQVELGAEDVPTYRFIAGVARTSLAQKTAARLGVTSDELRALIKAKKGAPPERSIEDSAPALRLAEPEAESEPDRRSV